MAGSFLATLVFYIFAFVRIQLFKQKQNIVNISTIPANHQVCIEQLYVNYLISI
jgi:hypothetical protein